MLNFFRKYQRYFFIVIAVVIVISFTFFGTYSTLVPQEEEKDSVVGAAVDGSEMHSKDLRALSLFLKNGEDEHGREINIFNDSVLHRDFLLSGLAQLLFEKYSEQLKGDLQERFNRAKAYRPYVHPEASFLSAEAMWNHFYPAMSQHLIELRAAPEPSFALFCQLYLDQTHFPPELLRRILSYQRSQYPGANEDVSLDQADLALFGFHSIEDWFGPRFVELMNQFIWNASVVAEQRGYRVSREEAKADLLQNGFAILQRETQKTDLSFDEVARYFQFELRKLGMDERKATAAWSRVLLFRRLFQDAGGAVFLDPLVHRQFESYANEVVRVEQYQLPEELRLKDFHSLLKLQVYLDATSVKDPSTPLALPKQFLPVEEVEKRFPELVAKRFELEYSQIKKEEIALQIGLKEIWEWELAENNWKELCDQFPTIAKGGILSREERFAELEKLETEAREKVDHFARDQMMAAHPEWMDDALEKAVKSKMTLNLKMAGGDIPFTGVSDPLELLESLERGETVLPRYSADGENFYRIWILKAAPSKEVLTFAEANREGILEALLDAKLRDAYPEVRKKNAALFRTDDEWKPFEEVRDQVGAQLFRPLLRAIERAHAKEGEELALQFYAKHRLTAHMEEAKSHPEAITSETNDALKDQWLLKKKVESVKRSNFDLQIANDLFALSAGTWSQVHYASNGDLTFFHILDKSQESGDVSERLIALQETLALDAKKRLFVELLDLFTSKKAIALNDEQHE